jgi:hypothetical protein
MFRASLLGTNQTVNEDAGAQTVNAWATNLVKGPDNEVGQDLSFAVRITTMHSSQCNPVSIRITGTLT